ncbi:MAG TPA: ATP-binding protein [Acidimicrobiia bacterium]
MSARRGVARHWSLRSRITAGALLVVVIALTAGGLLLIRVLQHQMTAQIDTTLEANADFVVRSLRTGTPLPVREGPTDIYVQFVTRDGRVLGASTAARGLPALSTRQTPHGAVRTVRSPALGELRVIDEPAPTMPGVTLVVARSSASVSRVRTSIVRVVALLIAAGSVLLGVLIWIVVGRALRPVDDMRRTVDAIGARDLGRRVDEPGTGDELDRLADTLNDLLARLDVALGRERQFVADASHELRTPIAGVRALLETEPSDPRSVADVRAEALVRLGQLQDLVESLLVLGRADDGAVRGSGPVDLDELVLVQAHQLARTTDLRVDTADVSGGQVMGREADLARVIGNLATNASRHARTTVAFSVCELADVVVFAVTDDGPGIDAADRDRVFERFRTLDDARSPGLGGTGLGLAIARSIVHAHGGTLNVEDGADGGARFVVRLPVAVAAPVGIPVEQRS